jgi:hypothetical protein
MGNRNLDGSAGDAISGSIGTGYSKHRQPEPRIADSINKGLGEAKRVINIGAGAGSYEPSNRDVVAIERSGSMRILPAQTH